MSNNVKITIIAGIFVLLAVGSAIWQAKGKQIKDMAIGNPVNKSSDADKNMIRTVESLINSGEKEGKEVKVLGRYNIKLISAGNGYEGPGGGDYLFGDEKDLQLEPQLKKVELDSQLLVSGNVRYCGGKKVKKYICGLNNVKVIKALEEAEVNQPDRQIDYKSSSEHKTCSQDSDCKLVKSYEPCTEVEAVNVKVSENEWAGYWEDLNKNRKIDTLYRCPVAELDMDNAKAVCRDGFCAAVKK